MASRLEATIYGKVQGVAFRTFAAFEARRLGLVGTVQNRSGGSVIVIAEGERTPLQSLLSRLSSGPSQSQVEHVDVRWSEVKGKGSFASFDIE